MTTAFQRQSSSGGFTFLELIIAVSILATIALFTSRMIETGISSKRKVQGMIDRSSGVRDVMGLMHRDISLAFHYQDLSSEIYNAAQADRRKKAQQAKNNPGTGGGPGGAGGTGSGTGAGAGGTGAGGAPADPNAEVPIDDDIAEKYPLKEIKNNTAFEGEEDKLSFSSLNNFRSSRDAQVSSQAEIGYFVESCTSRKKKEPTQCLFRRSSPYIDEDIKIGGKKQAILENVKSLKFRYLTTGDTEDVWRKNWSSTGKESSDNGKFPIAVEISLTVDEEVKGEGASKVKKEVSLTTVAPVLFPNNKTKEETPK